MSTNSVDTVPEDDSQYKIGTRVIRNLSISDYYQHHNDSSISNTTKLDSTTFRKNFSSIVGTVTKFCSNRQITVFWDDGTESEYRSDQSNELRIVNNSTTGVFCEDLICCICYKKVIGILWTCVDCENHTLCSSCYHGDKHDLEHRFARTVDPYSTSDLVEPRSGSNKIVLQGIFRDSEVVRIHDLSRNKNKKNICSTGTVVKYEFSENIAHVKWNDGKEESYSIGNSGKVLLKVIRPSNGPHVYHDHLPLFNETVFEKLFHRISEPDERDPFAYALHHAVLAQNLKIFEHLKNYRADLDACDFLKQTPLYIAVCLGHTQVVAKLIECGCDPQKKNILKDSCLLFAIRNKKDKIFELLLNSNLTTDTFKEIIFYSIKSRYLHSLSMILKHFKNKEALDSMFVEFIFHKVSLLQYAVLRDNYEACEMLIRIGKIDLNIRSIPAKETALYMACKQRNMNIFKLLLSENCDVNVTDEAGDTALDHIMSESELLSRWSSFSSEKKLIKTLEEMAIMLVSKGAKLGQGNNKQKTVLNLTKNFVAKLLLASKESSQYSSLEKFQQMEQRLEEFEEKFTCPICMDRHKNIIFQCGHGICDPCAGPFLTCPVCRQQIKQKIKMF